MQIAVKLTVGYWFLVFTTKYRLVNTRSQLHDDKWTVYSTYRLHNNTDSYSVSFFNSTNLSKRKELSHFLNIS